MSNFTLFFDLFSLGKKTNFIRLIFLFTLISNLCWGQTVETFSTSGTFTWVCPAGVTSVQVEAWGGGGAGGGTNTTGVARAGGGGGGGAYSKGTFTVVPGTSYSIVVGAGGAGVSANNGNNGGDSTFNTNSIIAVGGTGGSRHIASSSTSVAGGAGGLLTSSIGTIKFSGGNGGSSTTSPASGGGGGSAGNAANGGNASGTTAGSGGNAGGGAGATGITSNGHGNSATAIGGGGSGGRRASTSSTASRGGDGGSGQVKLTYSCIAFSSLPWTESFESITTGIPSCWGFAGTSSTSPNYHFQSFATGQSGRGMRFDSYSNSSDKTSELITPTLDLSSLSSAELRFYFKNPTGGNLEVLISSDNGTTYTSLQTNLTAQTAWIQKTYTITSYISPTVKIKFKGTSNWGSGDAYIYLDEVNIQAAPSCLTPIISTTTAIETVTATLNWTAPTTAPSNGYQWEVRTSGAGGSGTTGLVANGSTAAGVLSANVSGLSAATTYTIYVRSSCGGTDLSSWSSATTFTTACTVPNNPGAITITSPSATGFTLNYNAASPAPTSYILFYTNGATLTSIPTLVNGVTYTNSTAYTFGGNSYNCISNSFTSPSPLSGGTSNTQFNYFLFSKSTTNSCSGNPYYSSGVMVSTITCAAAPTVPVSSAISTTGATVSWTASAVGGGAGAISYTLEVYTDAGYTTHVSGSPFSMGTSLSQALTGLTVATTYYYRIKANNGSCDSTYLTGSFATLKNEPTNQVTNLAAGTVTATAIPLTWTAAVAGAQLPDGYLVKASSISLASITDPVDGTDPADVTVFTSNAANKKQTTGTAASTTTFTGTAPGTMYHYKTYSYTNSGTAINFKTDAPATLSHATKPNAASSTLTSETITTSSIGFSWSSTLFLSASNDYLIFAKAGSAITAGTPVLNPTTYTANATFGSGTAYEADASAFCVYKGDGTSLNLSGLNASTTYHFLIYAVVETANSNGTFSYLSGTAVNRATLCTTEIAPTTTETFSTFTGSAPAPICWSETTSTTVAAPSTLTIANSEWTSSTGFANTGTNVAVKTNLYSTDSDDWLLSQSIDLGTTPGLFRVKYDMAVTTYNGTVSVSTLGTHIVRVIISTDGGVTWSSANTLKTYTGVGSYSNTGQTEYINLSGYSGVIKVAFVATTSSNTPDVDFHIDNFAIEAIPTPTITSVASSAACGTTATLTITGTNLSSATSVKVGGTTISPLLTNTATQITATLSAAVSGTVEVVTAGGTVTSTGSVAFAIAPTVTISATTQTNCSGVTNATLTTITSTVGNYTTYAWSPATGFSGDATNGWTFNPTATTTYTLTASNATSGCSNTVTKTVTLNTSPSSVTVSPATSLITSGEIVTLTSSGGTITNALALSEDFNGDSIGWTTLNNSVGGAAPADAAWTYYISDSSFQSNDNTNYVETNSDVQGSGGTTDTALISPTFNLVNYTSASLKFYHFNRHSTGQTAKVQISTNNGATYTNLQNYTSTQGAALTFALVTIDLSAYLGQSNLKIRFKFDSAWGYYWALDNVTVSGALPTTTTWSPTTGLYTNAGATNAYTGGAATTVYAKPTATTTYTATATATASGCTVSGTAQVNVRNSWTGAVSSSWNNTANWSANTVPTSTDDIVISTSTPNAALLDIDFTLSSGKTLTISGTGTLTINSERTLTIEGTADFGGKLITFKSDATGSPRLGQVTGTLIGASNVKVERYIAQGKRAFRLVAPGVTTTNFIKNNWQEATHITGSTTGANGFDQTASGGSSMFTYNNQVATGTGWTAIANTNGTNLEAEKGYRLLVRGDRTPSLLTSSSADLMNTAITLSATGTLKTGTVTINATSTPVATNNTTNGTTNGFSLVGNPYVSPIDWHNVTKTNLNDTYYIWDTNVGTSAQRGRYVSYSQATGINNYGNTGVSTADRYLQAGQAFFVKNTTLGTPSSLVFNESNKAATSPFVLRTNNQNTLLSVLLYAPSDLAIGGYPIDGITSVFGTNFDAQIGYGDVLKLESSGENLAWFTQTKKLDINAQAPVVDTDVLLIKSLRLGSNKSYTFRIKATNFDTSLTGYLVDNYLNTQQVIDFTQDYFANFSTTADAQSFGEDRFKIVFSTALNNNQFTKDTFVVYPNPVVNNQFTIKLPATLSGNVKVTVHNLLGQEVFQVNTTAAPTLEIAPKNILSSGVYVVSVIGEGISSQQKITVQ